MVAAGPRCTATAGGRCVEPYYSRTRVSSGSIGTMLMTLSINVLGPLVLKSDGYRLGKLPKKARALLAFLAAQNGHAVTRERLADLLWPYQGSEQARHSLRNCLLELRKALGQEAATHLMADFATCGIQHAKVDLEDFERLSRSQHRCDLRAAAELYRGDFLADFYIASEPFQEWLAGERDRTLATVCEVLQRLSAQQDAAGEHEAAIQSGRRLVMLDPLSELGQRVLMRAYARAGRRGEALRQYKTCVETLKRELGVTPDGKTQALAGSIARSGGETAQMASSTAGNQTRALFARKPHFPVSGGADSGDSKTAMALLAPVRCRGGCADAQPDRRSRSATAGGRFYRRPGHRPPSAKPRSLPQTPDRGASRDGQGCADAGFRTRI